MTAPFAAEEIHDMLLRVAGWVPDDMLSDARSRLALGDGTTVARTLVFAGTRSVLPLLDDDLDVLAEVLEAGGADPELVGAVYLVDESTVSTWRFTAHEPAADEDRVGRELAVAVADEPGARALWRAVRMPSDGLPYPPPRSVYVVEVDEDAQDPDSGGLAALTGRLQWRLAELGERHPQVEVVGLRGIVPSYQRLAITGGAPLWSAEPELEPAVARVFDAADPDSGPSFAPDHPVIEDEAERAGIIAYLRTGAELLMTMGAMDDVVAPERGEVVPMTFRTDGRWIWSEASAYYLEQHHLAPDPELLSHIRAVGGPPPRPDTAAMRRAMAVLTAPVDDESSWTVPTGEG
jgi:hypothetical protein